MMKNRAIVVLVFIFLCLPVFSQNTVHGYLKSEQSGQPVGSVSCFDAGTKNWTISDDNGYFNLQVGKTADLQFTRVGFVPKTLKTSITNDTLITVQLTEKQLNEVLVIAPEEPIHRQTLSGKTTISARKLQSIPSFAGIPDLIKAITYTPGVSGGKDGFANIYVRGGNRDQNLILFDEIPVFNTNHFPGFVSVFNSNVISELDLYKGGFPARYGGKASSVIDVKSRNGDMQKAKGSFNVGILNSDFLIEFPLKNQKTSVLLAARTTYYNLLSMKQKRRYEESFTGSYMDFTFFDTNLKISHRFNQKHQVSLSTFSGHDFYRTFDKVKTSSQTSKSEFGYNQHNTGASLNHDFVINSKTTLQQSVIFSKYTLENFSDNMYEEYSDTTQSEFNLRNDINDLSYKLYLNLYHFAKHEIKTGVQFDLYSVIPSLTKIERESGQLLSNDKIRTESTPLQAAFFIEDLIKFSRVFNVNAGIRANLFRTDTSYLGMEPRISARYLLNENYSVKAGYTRMSQPIHVVVNNAQGIGQEIWLASDNKLAPETAEQFSCGFFGKIPNIELEFGVEAFYKTMKNLIYYKYLDTGEEMLQNLNQLVVSDGTGKAYGAEVFIKKQTPRMDASLSYTLMKSTRKFSDINNGNAFPHNFDKPHDLSVLFNFKINESYELSANFIYNTGTPISLPIAYVAKDDFFYGYYAYGSINNRRLPDYHRLDINLKKKWLTKKENHAYFSINIFNAYAHQNAVYIYFDNNKVRQRAFYSILPTINFGVKFK